MGANSSTSTGSGPFAVVAAILGAAALAAPLIASNEGYEPVGYRDPAPGAYESICYGHKQAGVLGKRYSDQRCAQLLADDAVAHGMDIAKCLPTTTPLSARAAFTSFAYNAGDAAFCGSTMARKAKAGDWWGACAELPKWTVAGGKTLPGLVARRKAERALCERDLGPPPGAQPLPKSRS